MHAEFQRNEFSPTAHNHRVEDYRATPPRTGSQHEPLQHAAAYFERSVTDIVLELECGDPPLNRCAWPQSSFRSLSDRDDVRVRVSSTNLPAAVVAEQPWQPRVAASNMIARQVASTDITDILMLLKEG